MGNISKYESQMVHFRVQSIKEIQVILNHFENYPLITQKQADYILFKMIVNLINNKKHLTIEGLKKNYSN